MLSDSNLSEFLTDFSNSEREFTPNITIQPPPALFSGVSTNCDSFAFTTKNSITVKEKLTKRRNSCQIIYGDDLSPELSKSYVIGPVSCLPKHVLDLHFDQSKNSNQHPCLPRLEQLLNSSSTSISTGFDFPSSCSNSIKDSQSRHWTHSRFSVKKTNFTWDIRNYSLLTSTPGETVISQPLKTSNHSWCIHLSPHGKTLDTREYLSIALVMHTPGQSQRVSERYCGQLSGREVVKRKWSDLEKEVDRSKTFSRFESFVSSGLDSRVSSSDTYSNLCYESDENRVPIRFRCSLLNRFGTPFVQSDTVRFHQLGPKMGLGFCRFVERSWLDSHFSYANLKTGSLLPDCLTIFAEIFYLEEVNECQQIPLDLAPTKSMSGPFIRAFNETAPGKQGSAPSSLATDFLQLLQKQAFADFCILFRSSRSNDDHDAVIFDLPDATNQCLCCQNSKPPESSFTLPCHRVFLIASCPLLSRSFKQYQETHAGKLPDSIVVQGMPVSELAGHHFLSFLYGGFQKTEDCLETMSHLDQFTMLALAKLFELDRLEAICLRCLMHSIELDNAVCLLMFSKSQHGDKRLFDAVVDFISHYAMHITETQSYLQLLTHDASLVAQLFCLLTKRTCSRLEESR